MATASVGHGGLRQLMMVLIVLVLLGMGARKLTQRYGVPSWWLQRSADTASMRRAMEYSKDGL